MFSKARGTQAPEAPLRLIPSGKKGKPKDRTAEEQAAYEREAPRRAPKAFKALPF